MLIERMRTWLAADTKTNARQPQPWRYKHLPATGRAARNHLGSLHQVRLEAAYSRDELTALNGADRAMPDLLHDLAAPGCSKMGSNWDRCGAHFVEPIEGSR